MPTTSLDTVKDLILSWFKSNQYAAGHVVSKTDLYDYASKWSNEQKNVFGEAVTQLIDKINEPHR